MSKWIAVMMICCLFAGCGKEKPKVELPSKTALKISAKPQHDAQKEYNDRIAAAAKRYEAEQEVENKIKAKKAAAQKLIDDDAQENKRIAEAIKQENEFRTKLAWEKLEEFDRNNILGTKKLVEDTSFWEINDAIVEECSGIGEMFLMPILLAKAEGEAIPKQYPWLVKAGLNAEEKIAIIGQELSLKKLDELFRRMFSDMLVDGDKDFLTRNKATARPYDLFLRQKLK